MCYLHDMHIAYSDLKSNKILLNDIEKKIKNKNISHVIVIIISKIEVFSNPKAMKNDEIYDSPTYIAPHRRRDKH